MVDSIEYQKFGWRHELWDVVRYFRSIGKQHKKLRDFWLDYLKSNNGLPVSPQKNNDSFVANAHLPLKQGTIELFFGYLNDSEKMLGELTSCLRSEEQALAYCSDIGISVDTTATQSTDHHQSSKSLVAAVTNIAIIVANELGFDVNSNPQGRCIWLHNEKLSVTARNLDGAIPSLYNPIIVWEIKEYWGKTKGGSKMSDAVYECQLVGREIREYEEDASVQIFHTVMLDGRDQWGHRVSDFVRFIDLYNQGIIDFLLVGRQVETSWDSTLRSALTQAT